MGRARRAWSKVWRVRDAALVHQELAVIQPQPGHLVPEHISPLVTVVDILIGGVCHTAVLHLGPLLLQVA